MERHSPTLRNVIIFTLVVLASGWIGQAVNHFTHQASEESLGMLIWLVSPLFAMIILRSFAGDGWKDIGLKPLLKGNLIWYSVALLIFPLITTICAWTGSALGWITMNHFNYSLFFVAFTAALLPNFIKNIPEEFVWRGYLTPKLILLKAKDWQLYLLVGIIWGVWHIPYYLYFLESEIISSFTSLKPALFIPLTIVTMIAWSVIFVELWLITKSIWPVVLIHMVEDAFVNPMILDSNFQIDPAKELLIHPVAGLLSIALYVLAGLMVRQYRLKKELKSV
jgi:membrane protease YdiL (CAAX protease family)